MSEASDYPMDPAAPAAALPTPLDAAAKAFAVEAIRTVAVKLDDCAPEAVTPAATLGADLGLDSLDRAELAQTIGVRLGVWVPDRCVGPDTTVAGLAEFVAAQLAERVREGKPEVSAR